MDIFNSEPVTHTVNTSSILSNTTVRPSMRQRVLACVLCQQRKVKCDRKFPCANCVKFRAQCIPATTTPRRPRRKVVEHDLITRLRRYEDLLRQHNIDFDPLPQTAAESNQPDPIHEDEHDSDHEGVQSRRDWPSPATTIKTERTTDTRYVSFDLFIRI